jgi:hypothetical protein
MVPNVAIAQRIVGTGEEPTQAKHKHKQRQLNKRIYRLVRRYEKIELDDFLEGMAADTELETRQEPGPSKRVKLSEQIPTQVAIGFAPQMSTAPIRKRKCKIVK